MALEKISSVQATTLNTKTAFKGEEEKPAAEKTPDNTKDVITVLSVLAAIGAAGIAIYKHKSAKEALKKAEEDAKKKVDEAKAQADKAAEETEAKIKEAVDKVRAEYEKSSEKVTDTSKTSESHRTKKKKNKNKIKKQNLTEVSTPAKEAETIDDNFIKQVEESQNGIIVIPRSTKLADFYTKIKNSVKNKFKRTPKEEKVAEDVNTEKKHDSKLKNFGTEISKTAAKTKNYIIKGWNDFLNLFSRKKQEVPVMKISDEGEKIRQNIKSRLSGKTDYEKLANDLINEPHSQAEHDRLQALYDTLALKEPEVSEIFRGIKLPDVTKVAEKDLLTEYKALEKTVKDLPALDLTAQRFLEVKGELLNHRGYKINQSGELIKKEAKEEVKLISDGFLKEASDLDLLVEYYFMKNKVQNLPVINPDSQRFLMIKGELLNHRGYTIKPDGKLKKSKADTETKKLSLTDKIKRFFNI